MISDSSVYLYLRKYAMSHDCHIGGFEDVAIDKHVPDEPTEPVDFEHSM